MAGKTTNSSKFLMEKRSFRPRTVELRVTKAPNKDAPPSAHGWSALGQAMRTHVAGPVRKYAHKDVAMRLPTSILSASALLAGPALACDTVDDVVKIARAEHSRVTIISEAGALSRALAFMVGNADEVQPADTLVVIQGGLKSEVVLMEKGCATVKALANASLVLELLRRASGDEEGDLI